MEVLRVGEAMMPGDDTSVSGVGGAGGSGGVLLTVRVESEEATDALGAAVGAVLGAGDVVCLHGDLGAGKTRLTRGIARGVGVDPGLVSSPTFVVVHEYPPARPGSPGLTHMDAYRLRGADELDTLGWDRVTGPEAAPLVVEWAERIESALRGAVGGGGGAPQPGGAGLRMDVAIVVESETSREVELRGPGAWTLRAGWTELARLGASVGGGAAARDGGRARTCPTCGKGVGTDVPAYPFCSERCRMADLGRWFGGTYSVSRELSPDDADDAGA